MAKRERKKKQWSQNNNEQKVENKEVEGKQGFRRRQKQEGKKQKAHSKQDPTNACDGSTGQGKE
jgi:hypothetical protein